MDTDGRPAGRRRRRPLPLRVKVALAGFAGVAAAWLIPRGGEAPAPIPTPTPSAPTGITAAEIPLSTIKAGVSFRSIDGVRVFLVRSGDSVVAFHGVATTNEGGSIFWCPKNNWFEGIGPGPYYERGGAAVRYSAPRNLDRISVIVAAGRVTIFPHQILPGDAATFPPGFAPAPPAPCPPGERVG